MKYRREEILPGVFLSALNTDKFKTAAMGVMLLSQLEREHAYMDELIPSVLRRGTVKSPDMPAVTRRLEMLYGAAAVPISLRVGEVRCTGFYCAFPEGRYLPGGARELESAAELLGELLIAPNTRGGLLLPEYVDSEKAKLAERIRAARRAANPEGITENTSKKKQQLRERQGREAAAKDFEAKKRAAAGLAPEEAAEVLSGDPERPFSRGRAYSSEHYTKNEENE